MAFFTDLKNNKAKCNFCQKEYSYKGGGAFNLIRHTKSKHPQVYVAIRECPVENMAFGTEAPTTDTTTPEFEIPTASTSTDSTSASTAVMPKTPATTSSTDVYKKAPATNTKLTQYFHKLLSAKKSEHLNKMLVKIFTKSYLPFHLIESPELKEFIKELNPAYQLPSRKTLSNALMTNLYNQTKEKVKSELSQAERVCITTDGWTSAPNDNYLAVTVHFFNQQVELKSFLLECIQFPDRHTAANLALELKRITDIWQITDKIVAVTSDKACNIKAAIRLNNEGYRFLSHQMAPLLTIDYPDTINMTSEDIEVLESAIKILSFFKDVTEEMSSEKNVTVSEVILISNALKNKCLKFLSSSHPDYVTRPKCFYMKSPQGFRALRTIIFSLRALF
ncbi:hypothetical protein evm_014470 [Chilo suppressalis]|nr:hypothetical protein evm_014470 [Chilo suppressalis]